MMTPISPIASTTRQPVTLVRRGVILRKADHQRTGQHGFTLIELLLAITIGSVVMGAVYATFNTAIGSQQRIQRVAEASQASRFFMELVRRDLKQLAARGEVIAGGTAALSLVMQQPDGALRKVSYQHKREQQQVVRSVTSAEQTLETIVYEEIVSLGFRYLMDGGWHTETNPKVLPEAIECALQIGEWVQRFTVTLEVENVPAKS